MKKFFLFLFLLCVGSSLCLAQTDDEKEKALADFRAKIHQLEIYNMVLPVLLKKDQLRALLKEVEKARALHHEILDKQYLLMKHLTHSVDDAIFSAATRGAVPGQELVADLYKDSEGTLIQLAVWRETSVDDLYALLIGDTDKGQQAVMANSLNPKDFPDELKKPEEVTQEDKIKLFIRSVLLDPDAYPILVKMSI